VAAHYGEWLTGGDVHSAEEIQPNSGAVVRQGIKKLAIYRDSAGQLHYFSAVCPHLVCVVHWNHGEKTWDCPCHGSRFDQEGKVLNGPANKDLEKVEQPEAAAGINSAANVEAQICVRSSHLPGEGKHHFANPVVG
jgi:nitrite reductase/ring-hydroxylating ferredoxin subunit